MPMPYITANTTSPATAPRMPSLMWAVTMVRQMPPLSGSSLRPGCGSVGVMTLTCAASSDSAAATSRAASRARPASVKTAATLLLLSSSVMRVSDMTVSTDGWWRASQCGGAGYVSGASRAPSSLEHRLQHAERAGVGVHLDLPAVRHDELLAQMPDHRAAIRRNAKRPDVVVKDLVQRQRAIAFARIAIGAVAEDETGDAVQRTHQLQR